jgi:hypothetical protein
VPQSSELPQAAPILWDLLRIPISTHLLVRVAWNHRGSPYYTAPTPLAQNQLQTNKQSHPSPNRPSTCRPSTSPRIFQVLTALNVKPHELRHAPDIPHQATPPATCGSADDTMESVIHEDSPLAEFLEGMRLTPVHHEATHTNSQARRGKRRALCTTVACCIHLLRHP